MAGILTQEEATRLIDMLKHTVEKQIYFPSEKGSLSFDVVGERRENEFIVNIDRKGKLAEKCTYQGRIRQTNQVLMRLDIDPHGRHTNPEPDGRVIVGNHLHIYSEEYGTQFAIPFNIENRDLYQLCFEFFERFNIIDPPNVYSQQTM